MLSFTGFAFRGRSSRCRMALLAADRGMLRFARAADRQVGGKGAEPPITPRQARRSVERNNLSWAGFARSAHFARPRLPARAAYQVPFCLSKMGHLRKACAVSGRNSPSIGMAARIGRPKSPRGFASGRYLILRPVGATAPPCGARGSLRGGRSPPRTFCVAKLLPSG